MDGASLDAVIREALSNMVAFEQRLEGSSGQVDGQ